ncbi:mechanosensitive ion channel [Nannocystis radixulma]|uniref:Mechanosensitive ion channel n=1 Tax=Nannocystis radixulma TaxID=2995305 RepID=A0ABT5B781_9BACT|nr:mechanosensitive ion channel [Nannocystis radixulma]MDC0669588.1 mechanosensitive ion channel [Nannocystis radixulma]
MFESISAPSGAPVSYPPTAPAGPGWLDSFQELWSDQALVIAERLGLALLIFIGGWLVAKCVSWLVYRALCATEVDNVLAEKLRLSLIVDGDGRAGGKDAKKVAGQLERFLASVVYYMLMLLVLVGVLQYAGLTQAAAPIQGLVETVVQALPLVGKALVLLVIAYFAGTILRKLVTRAVDLLRLDARFAELSETPAEATAAHSAESAIPRPFSKTAGDAVFWLVMVAGLAGAFDAMKIAPVAGPLNNAIDRVVALAPRLAVAGVIVAAGYVLARIARVVVQNLLDALGLPRLVARLGLAGLFAGNSPSAVVGLAVMAFIVLQATIAGLNELGLVTIAGPLTEMTARVWLLLPDVAVSTAVVVLGVLLGRIGGSVVGAALRGFGFDALLLRLGFPPREARPERIGEPSELAGALVQIAVILLAVAQACQNLGLLTWAAYVDAFLAYLLRHVLVAMLIVGVGLGLGGLVRDLLAARAAPGEARPLSARWLGEFARYTVLVFAFTMAVHQLGVAQDFVLMSFGLLFGALCLAAALAFGLGARDVAGDIVRRRYQQIEPGAPAAPVPRQQSGPLGGGMFRPPPNP